MRSASTWMAGLLALAGCPKTDGGDTGTTDTSPPTDTAPTHTGCGNYPPTWQGVQDFFVVDCDRCHATASGLGGLDLRAAVIEDVNNCGGRYVLPGVSEGSELWTLISGSGLPPMPSDTAQLPDEEICHVEEWIDAGASLE